MQKFLSLEPLLGPLRDLNLYNIDWVIVGGESGPKARPMKKEWVLDIKEQCEKAGVKFFFKQWGGLNKKKTGRQIEGKTYDEMPDAGFGFFSCISIIIEITLNNLVSNTLTSGIVHLLYPLWKTLPVLKFSTALFPPDRIIRTG